MEITGKTTEVPTMPEHLKKYAETRFSEGGECFPTGAFLITAYNPKGIVVSDSVNKKAQGALLQSVEEAPHLLESYGTVDGVSADGKHSEEMLAVTLKVPVHAQIPSICAVALVASQDAIFHIGKDRHLWILDCETLKAYTQGKTFEELCLN